MHAGRIRVAIANTGGSVAKDCYGRITLDCTPQDVLLGAMYSIPTFVTAEEYTQIDRTSLCWSFAGNPHRMNMPVGGVPEMLDIACLQVWSPDRTTNLVPTPEIFFNIPSEQGWGQFEDQWNKVERKSRVVLRPRTYTGTLLIGGEDIQPITRTFVLGYIEGRREPYFELGVDSITNRLPNQ